MAVKSLLKIKRARRAVVKVKFKTRKSVAKRFDVSGSGKIIMNQSGKRHNMSNKSKRTLLSQKGRVVAESANVRLVRKALGLKTPKVSAVKYVPKTNIPALKKSISKLLVLI